jgi:amidohydrolase
MNQDLIRQIKAKTTAILPAVKQIRHQLHSEPEVGLDTLSTRECIRASLVNTKLDFRQPLMKADVIGELKGRSDLTICLRADMDALPMAEQSGVPYHSKRSGFMHACGHDGHSAILIGTALVLDSLVEYLPVTVRFIFQPGEEMVCGGKTLVELGACESAAAAFALHGWPGLPVGQVSTREGPLLAAGGYFTIQVTGKGCHGAQPERGKNPIPVTAAIIDKLDQLHQHVYEKSGSILSVCLVNSGDSANIIPDTAIIQGTTRYLSIASGLEIEKNIRSIVDESDGKDRIKVLLNYENRYSLPVLNTKVGFNLIQGMVKEYFPLNCWREMEQPSMVNEDFAFYLEGREGAMFLLGLGEDSPPLHSPRFDFNDQALENGILMMTLLALNYGS